MVLRRGLPASPKNWMKKMDHLMAEKNENNKDSQMGQVTPTNKRVQVSH